MGSYFWSNINVNHHYRKIYRKLLKIMVITANYIYKKIIKNLSKIKKIIKNFSYLQKNIFPLNFDMNGGHSVSIVFRK